MAANARLAAAGGACCAVPSPAARCGAERRRTLALFLGLKRNRAKYAIVPSLLRAHLRASCCTSSAPDETAMQPRPQAASSCGVGRTRRAESQHSARVRGSWEGGEERAARRRAAAPFQACGARARAPGAFLGRASGPGSAVGLAPTAQKAGKALGRASRKSAFAEARAHAGSALPDARLGTASHAAAARAAGCSGRHPVRRPRERVGRMSRPARGSARRGRAAAAQSAIIQPRGAQ